MLDSIRSFFERRMPPPEDGGDDTDLDEESLRVAACALLLELAWADDEFTEEEARHLEAAVRRHFALDPEAAAELVELAEREREGSVDLWQFTSLVEKHYSRAQKLVLAEVMWGLVHADGRLVDRESMLLRKISNLLKLEPGYLARARRRAEEGDDGR